VDERRKKIEIEKELKILMLEDVAEEAGLIERVLRRENFLFKSMRVDTSEEFSAAIDQFVPDIILSDHALPQFNSIEALKMCRTRGLIIPFILVTGTVSEEFAVNCLKEGVDDYILKDNLSRLPSAIVNAINQRKLEGQRLAAELRLRDQNEELSQANEDLKKTNMELDKFVYSVSHNLRAPLTSVLGLVGVAKLEIKKGEQPHVELFNMIEKSIHRLDETIKQILDYSQNARTTPAVHPIHFEKLIDTIWERLSYLRGIENLKKEVKISGDDLFFSDPQRLSLIFENLISNGIIFSDESKTDRFLKITISISAEQANIEFWDNGIGIEKDHLPFIFNMFYRATERSLGSGLGLYVVRESVEKLGGSISLESELQQQTRFRIKLPNLKNYGK
jgi:signal transduction histidine kinase